MGGCLWSHWYHVQVKRYRWWNKNLMIVQPETSGRNIKFLYGSCQNSKLCVSIVMRAIFTWKVIISSWENTNIYLINIVNLNCITLKFYLNLIDKSVMALVIQKLLELRIYSSLIINIGHILCIIHMSYIHIHYI